MKNKILRILGVVVTLATLMSLFVSAVPVSAGTQSWTKVSIPSADLYQVSSFPATDGFRVLGVGKIVYNSDKSIIWASVWIYESNDHVNNTNGVAGVQTYEGPALMRSLDGGRSWKKMGLSTYEKEWTLGSVGAATGTATNPQGYNNNAAGGLVPGTMTITDIATSPTSPGEVYFTNGYEIYTSKDGAASSPTWQKLSNVFIWGASHWPAGTAPVYASGNMITTLDVAQFGSTKLVFAGTANMVGPHNNTNGVFFCTESTFGMPWDDLSIATQGHNWKENFGTAEWLQVWDVKVDPTDFAVKQGVFAVVSIFNDDNGNGTVQAGEIRTLVTAKYLGNQWNQASLCQDAVLKMNASPAVDIVDPILAEIWLPSDFNSTLSGTKFQSRIALATDELFGNPQQGDIFMWIGGGAVTIDLDIRGAETQTAVTDIDGVGGVAASTLIAGGWYNSGAGSNEVTVWRSTDGYTFTADSKRPTGSFVDFWGLPPGYYYTSVLALKDFGTNGQCLAGTDGLFSGVSYSADFGKTWNTISLMRSDIASTTDLGGSMFMVTRSNAGWDSCWKQVTIGTATYWERVYSESFLIGSPMGILTGTWDVEQAPDGTVFLADINGVRIWKSVDNGQTWTGLFNDITSAVPTAGTAITAWLPVSVNSVIVGGASTVFVTVTNGAVWLSYSCAGGSGNGIGTVTDFAVASNGDLFAAGVSGGNTIKVAKSTAASAGTSWSILTVPASITSPAPRASITTNGGLSMAWVVAADDYATTGNVFVSANRADAVNGTSVWRYPVNEAVSDTGTGWNWVDNDNYDSPSGDVIQGAGLVAGPGGPGSTAEGSGMVYATDFGNGVSRIRGLSTEAENLGFPVVATPITSFNGLWLTKSGADNVLWTIGSDQAIWTYTDTLNKAGSGVSLVSSTYYGTAIYGFDPGFPTGIFVAVVKWTAMTNAEDYAVYISDDVDDDGLYDLYEADAAGLYSWDDATQVTITPLAPNTTYYVSVWAVTESANDELCSSFLFDKKPMSFTTAPAVPNWTPNLSPMSGAQNVQVGPTPFDWDDVTGATGYEFQIAEGNGIPSGTAVVSLTISSHSISNLKNSTFYTWRVRAMNGTVAGDWITSVFTTVAAVVPPVTIAPAPPAPTINLPQPTVIVNPAPITITIPPGTTLPAPTLVLPEAETPVYIWIIVAVGALLTVAVIVLIIRTRRVV